MLKPLYDWTMSLAGHRHAMVALALVAFKEFISSPRADNAVYPTL